MKCRVDEIDVYAVVHPIRGLVLMGHYVGQRTAGEGEIELSLDATLPEIAAGVFRLCEGLRDPRSDS
jgi:hypothetical protein